MLPSFDAFAGYAMFFLCPIDDDITKALQNHGVIVTIGDECPDNEKFDLVVDVLKEPNTDLDGLFNFISENIKDHPEIRLDENSINVLYGDFMEILPEVNKRALQNLQKDSERLDNAKTLQESADIFHSLKSTLGMIGYVGVKEEITAWEKIWRLNTGKSIRYSSWEIHKATLLGRINLVVEKIK